MAYKDDLRYPSADSDTFPRAIRCLPYVERILSTAK